MEIGMTASARRRGWRDMTLDQLLLERGVLDQDQLSEIQRVRAMEGGGWAGHFVDAGVLTENELMSLAISETGLPYIPLLQVTTPSELIQEFSYDFLMGFECFPVDSVGPCLTVVTPNPFQPDLVRSREWRTRSISLFVGRMSEWRERMRRSQQETEEQSG